MVKIGHRLRCSPKSSSTLCVVEVVAVIVVVEVLTTVVSMLLRCYSLKIDSLYI